MEIEEKLKSALYSRCVAGVLSAGGLQLALLAVVDGLLFTDFWNPIYWFFSAKLLKAFAPTIFIMFLIGYVKLQLLSRDQKPPVTRFEALRRRFSWRVFVNLVLYTIFAASIPLGYCLLNRMTIFPPQKERINMRLVDKHSLFVVLCACWSGMLYAWQHCATSINYTRFPVVHQNLFMKQRNKLIDIVTAESLPSTFLCIVYFFPFFFMCCSTPQFFGLAYINDSSLLSIKLIFQSWILSAVVYSSLKLLKISLDYYLTQNVCFPVSQMITLLDTTKTRFYTELALQDLYLLAHGRGTLEVGEIFSLGQPGGAPVIWEGIFGHCVAVIKKFNWEMGLSAKETEDQDICKTPSSDKHYPMTARRLADIADNRGVSPGMKKQEHTVMPQIQNLISNMKMFKLYKYFFDVDRTLRESVILENSQQVIWAVGALSVLASRALTEDRFGIVVNDLPIICTELLNIRSSIMSTKRRTHLSKKAHRIRAALRDVTARGLFRISRTYADYLDVLPLPPDVMKDLRSFANVRGF